MKNNYYDIILKYFKLIAFQHNEIVGYDYGETYELNDQYDSYPLLFVETPSTVNYGTVTGGSLELDWVTLSINLHLLDKDLEDYNDAVENEFAEVELRNQEKRLGELQTILAEVLKRVVGDCDDWVLKAVITNTSAFNVTRVTTNDLLGYRVAITFKFALDFCGESGFDTTKVLPINE